LRDKTFRTIGASAVLLGVVVAGLAQINTDPVTAPVEIVDSATPTPTGRPRADARPPVSAPEPFVYRIGVLSGISTDNFWAFYGEQPSVWNSYILGPTKPALFTVDSSNGVLRPELSQSDVSPTWDATGWRVRVDLADDFRWSDGTPITAHDLVFTFNTVRALGLGGSWAESFPAAVESIHADSDHQVRIEFTERPNLAVWPHGVGLAPILAKHVWESHTDGATAESLYALSGSIDVGGGPLSLTLAQEDVLVSAANPGYPGSSTPDAVEYHVYATEDDVVAAIASGEIDSVLTPKGLAPEHLTRLEAVPTVEVLDSPANGVRYLGFNLEREPMSDHAFRTALALLLDREKLSETIAQTGDATSSIVPEANIQWFDSDAAAEIGTRYGGDLTSRLATALEGLRKVGYTWTKEPTIGESGSVVVGEGLKINGQSPQPLTILTAGDEYDPARPRYVQEIAGTLALLGFDARPVETDFDTVVDLAFTPGDDGLLHYDMYMLGWTLGSPALPGYYRPLFATDGVMNNTGYSSEAFTKALDAYENAFSAEAARDALWVMEETLSIDLPYLPLYTPQITEIYRSDRVRFDIDARFGGLQARLGGIGDVRPIRASTTLAR